MSFSALRVLLQSTRISTCSPEREETHTHLRVAVVMKDWVCSVSKEAKGLCWGAGGRGMSAQAVKEPWVLAVLCCWSWEKGLIVLQQLSSSSPATPSQVTALTHHTELCCKTQPSALAYPRSPSTPQILLESPIVLAKLLSPFPFRWGVQKVLNRTQELLFFFCFRHSAHCPHCLSSTLPKHLQVGDVLGLPHCVVQVLVD